MTPAGRYCPVDYFYRAATLARAADIRADTLYVVGGLYGNVHALDAIAAMVAAEPGKVTLVFNGDFHWFDAAAEWFAEVHRRVAQHHALRGNVEAELARVSDVGAGCGCAYPEAVDDATVERSNHILARLRECASALPGVREQLVMLPMTLVAQVGALRIGIVHGDAEALAGWRFAHDQLHTKAAATWLDTVRAESGIDVFASTHTCLPVLRDFDLRSGRLTIANNGAAGMPNFRGTAFGLLTRISIAPSPHRPLYGIVRDRVFVDALPIAYDQGRWLRDFAALWPAGSAAHESYLHRLVDGPPHGVGDAFTEPRASVASACSR